MKMDKLIASANELKASASRHEFAEDWDKAFSSYLQAAESFLDISRTTPVGEVRDKCKAAASTCLERAQRIKKNKRDLKPVLKDPFSKESQAAVLDRSSRVNGFKFPIWNSYTPDNEVAMYNDPDGLVSLSPRQASQVSGWKRPSEFMSTPKIFSPALRPLDINQHMPSDCSVIAGLIVCLEHHRRFNSKLGVSSLFPQDNSGVPTVSQSGKYQARFFFNGAERQVIIDDALPVRFDGTLACASERTNEHLWPSLMEKAYMKLNGGYDFPGSDSSIDIYALTGWLPDHISIQSANFRREKYWSYISNGFKHGKCLVTCGTARAVSHGLIPNHDYAVIDIYETGERRVVCLLNPWNEHAMSRERSLESSLEYLSFDDGPVEFDWDDLCDHFESLYLNWDPNTFSHTQSFHGIWASEGESTSRVINHDFRLKLDLEHSPVFTKEIWCLLTRHVISKEHGNDEFIALHPFSPLDDQDEHTNILITPKGGYTNSPHTLAKISAHEYSSNMVIVASRYNPSITDIGYTLRVCSPYDFRLEDTRTRFPYSTTRHDSLSLQNSGGNSTFPTFMNNPQYTLQIHPRASIPPSAVEQIQVTVQASKDVPINAKIMWSGGERVYDLSQGDIALDSGAYQYGFAYGAGNLKPGRYTLVVSAFEPGMRTEYGLTVQCTSKFDLKPLPREGAGMFANALTGPWEVSSATNVSFDRLARVNPTFILSVPTTMQLLLQSNDTRARITTKFSLFVKSSTDGRVALGPQVLTSGDYTDARSGSVTKSKTVNEGEYLLVAFSTRQGTEDKFTLVVYSSEATVRINRVV